MYKKIVISASCGIRLLVGACLLMSMEAYAQKYTDIPINNRVILNKGEYIVYAEIAQGRVSDEVSDDVFYYWYSANEIKRTQGGYDGKLLHGKYTEFYSNKDLKAQGKFSHGVKTGQWKMWHANGNLREIQFWSSKGRRAKFESFDENGNLIRSGKYRYERLHGIIKEIERQKTVKRKFRDGIELIRAKKSKSDSTLDNKSKKKWKFGFLRLNRHKKDTLNNPVRKKEEVKKSENTTKRDKGQEKNKKSKKDLPISEVKNKEGVSQELQKDNSKKAKRRKKTKADTTSSNR